MMENYNDSMDYQQKTKFAKAPVDKPRTSTTKFEEFFTTTYKNELFEFLSKFPDNRSLTVDYNSLEKFDSELAELLIGKPEEVIEAAKIAIENIEPIFTGYDFNVRFENITNFYSLENLRSKQIGSLVMTRAFIKDINDYGSRIETGVFECRGCMRLHEVEQTSGSHIIEPSLCTECGGRSFRLLQEESSYIDTQNMLITHPDTNRELLIILEDDLCSEDYSINEFKEITGILKTFREEKTRKFKQYLYVNHIKSANEKYIPNYEEEFEDEELGRNSPEGVAWRNAVLNRDGVCRCCGVDKPQHLEAHHIFSWKDYPDLRFNVDNGVTLCKWCHRKYNSYFGHKGTGIGIVNFLNKFGSASKTIIKITPEDNHEIKNDSTNKAKPKKPKDKNKLKTIIGGYFTSKENIISFLKSIEQCEKRSKNGCNELKLYYSFEEKGAEREEIDNVIKDCIQRGLIYYPAPGYIKLVDNRYKGG